jgi:two-component system, cell cycle response regulator DivK
MAKILIVEDNEMNMDMLSRRLTRHGFEVVTATDGGQGISVARSEKPDLILMDMGLPVVDGWEATRQLKAAGDTRFIPIIALTAHAVDEERERCMAAGCDDYESKPVKFEKLMVKIEGLIGKPG